MRVCWPALARLEFFSAYMRSSASCIARSGSAVSVGTRTVPCELAMLNAPPCSLSASTQRRSASASRAVGEEGAELVPSEPVAVSVRLDGDRERVCQAREQQVAAVVAERVVVGLEAVEVEHDETCRPLDGGRARDARQVGRQLPAVGETGQRIVRRLCVQLLREAASGDGRTGGAAGSGSAPRRA